MSGRPEHQTLSSLELAMAPCYCKLALQERAVLTPSQLVLLRHELDRTEDSAYVLAVLHLVREEMQKREMTQADLLGYFDVTANAIGKWFSRGEISSAYVVKLMHLPEFENIRAREEDLLEHQYRSAITWIRSMVLGEGRVKMLKYQELHYLAALHCIDDLEIASAFGRIPNNLVHALGRQSEGWAYTLRSEWGRAYRLYVTEVENGA